MLEYTEEEKNYLTALDEYEYNLKTDEEKKRIIEITELNKTLMYDDDDEDSDEDGDDEDEEKKIVDEKKKIVDEEKKIVEFVKQENKEQ